MLGEVKIPNTERSEIQLCKDYVSTETIILKKLLNYMEKELGREAVKERIKKNLNPEIVRVIKNDDVGFFSDYDNMKEINELVKYFGYQVIEAHLLGKKYGVLLKENWIKAILNPQKDDANILKKVGKKINISLKIEDNPELAALESNLEKTVLRAYTSSLLMNLFEYPTNKLNENTLEKMGLFDKGIKRLYLNAITAWLGEDTFKEIPYYKGSSVYSRYYDYTKPDYTLDVLFRLPLLDSLVGAIEEFITNKLLSLLKKCIKDKLLLKNIFSSKETFPGYSLGLFLDKEYYYGIRFHGTEIPKKYLEIEKKISGFIFNHAGDKTIVHNSKNLIRLYLNITTLYEKGKPLPIEWGKWW